MSTASPTRISALPADRSSRLRQPAQDVSCAEGTCPFREGGHAHRFRILRSGTVALDVHMPGRRAAVIEPRRRSAGRLLVAVQPNSWRLRAEAMPPVRARLQAAGVRFPDLNAPCGSGSFL
ncbi:regulator [Streptomyces roseus]|uniref:regulator n=1 Tax=Streptomyces roseus TaxID=66430 RepID=UPI00380FE4C7